MRDYGVVSPQFWIGKTGKSLRGDMPAQLVALYLMTSPHANMIGVFYVTPGSISEETGLPLEGASKALQSLIEAQFCQFDDDTNEVFVQRMAAFQIGEQLEPKDNRCKGVARELEKVMSDKLRRAFHATYSGAFHLPAMPGQKPKKASPSKAPSKPGSGSGSGSGTGPEKDTDAFEAAMVAYPRRPGASKADALKAWAARVSGGADPAVILAGVNRYAAYCAACGTEPNFIKQPATFFGPGEHYLSDWTPPARAAPATTETSYQRSQRELVEQATGGLVSRKNPGNGSIDERTAPLALGR
jgi:hypothetical protein